MMIVWRMKGKIIIIILCCVVYDSCAQWYAHTRTVLDECWFRFTFSFLQLFKFRISCVFFWLTLDCFVLVLFAFVVLSLVSSVLRQEIGWEEERLRSDLFCVVWDVCLQSCSELQN